MAILEPQLGYQLTIDIRGLPVPQGSLRMHALPNGKVATRYAPGVYKWRAQVQQAVTDAMTDPFVGAVEVRLGFELPRPQGHYGTGRNAGTVKASAPAWPTHAPDIDKLTRAILDSCTDAGLWKDDAQVVVLHAAKRFATTNPGVRILVIELL